MALGAGCVLAPPWATSPHVPSDLGHTTPASLSPARAVPLRPLTYRVGPTALAGEVIQALILQLLGDERDHGRGPEVLALHQWPLRFRTIGLSGPGPLLGPR